MTSVWTGAVADLARAQADAATPLDAKNVAMLQRFVDLGKRELARLEPLVPDPAAQAATLEFDVGKIFAFVRDSVANEPYAGVLRGARGALAARSANASDKALLLKAMLEAAGTSVRLVSGKLPADRAGALVDGFLAADPLAGPLGGLVAGAGLPAGLDEFCKSTGLDRQQMDRVGAEVVKQATDTQRAVETQTDAAVQYLQAQIKANGLKIGQSAAEWRSELIARVTPHVWVRYQDETGKWADLDPSFKDAPVGRSVAEAGAEVTGDLPGRHVVNLKLDYTAGGKTTPLLVVPLNADEAMTRPASFAILAADSMPAVDTFVNMTPAERAKVIGGINKYQALVRSGDRTFAAKVFDLKGNTYDVSGDGRISGAGQLGQNAGGVFSGLGGGDAKPAGSFEALTMTISFDTPPGQKPVPPQKRVLLTAADLVGNHNVSLLVDWEILIQSQLISAEAGLTGQLRNLIGIVEPTLAAVRKIDAGQRISYEEVMNAAPPRFPHALVQFSLFRQGGLARTLKAEPVAAVLWETPQVIIAERRFCLNKTSGHMCDRSRIDIVHNGLALVPTRPDAAEQAARLATRQGVYDTVAEHVILQKVLPDGIAASAAATLDKARASGGKLAAFRATDAGASALSEADRAFVSACETDRHVLVPPADGESAAAWWSIDPRTGSVVGRGSGGYGESLVENALLQQLGAAAMCFLAAGKDAQSAGGDAKSQRIVLASFLACTVAMGTGVLGVVGGGMTSVQLGWCAWANIAIAGGITYAK